MKRSLFLAAVTAALLFPKASAQSLEETFRTPPEEAKPLMIWQWMDGMVTREGITADLEAYKAAGIGGVQQFLVGGGSFMLEVPEWLRSGSARPSQGRKAVVSYKVIRKDTPLLPSGLIGPAVLLQVEK